MALYYIFYEYIKCKIKVVWKIYMSINLGEFSINSVSNNLSNSYLKLTL